MPEPVVAFRGGRHRSGCRFGRACAGARVRRFLLLLGVAPLFGCNVVFWDEPECEDEEFAPLPLCSDEVEAVIRSLPTDEWARMEPPIAHARGDHRGDVVEVRDALVVVDLLGERRTLHWPEPLPFAMEPGEEFVARIGGNSVTLYFSKGSRGLRGLRAGCREDRHGPRDRRRRRRGRHPPR